MVPFLSRKNEVMKRPKIAAVVVAAGVAGGALGVSASPARVARRSAVVVSRSGPRVLDSDGIGNVHFGLERSRAVTELRRRFGAPSAMGVNTGCGPRYREVVWGDLLAEFGYGKFTGYRYVTAGYAIEIPGKHSAPAAHGSTADLTTASGITTGSTLAQVRDAYKELAFIGTDRWKARNGIVFVDNALRDPEPPSSRIIEIKNSTCGDY